MTHEPAFTLETVRHLIGAAIHLANFFIAPPRSLEWQHVDEHCLAWEIYRGRLLDRSQTNESRCFEAWNVFAIEEQGRSGEPLLSVLLDRDAGQLHVTRAIHCYGWEGYHAGNNVYLSREVTRWVRELVGTIAWAEYADPQDLKRELKELLFRAIVGLSRLPLTSVEAPLPGFSLGQLGYFDRGLIAEPLGPMHSYGQLVKDVLRQDLEWLKKARLLELILRSTPREELDRAADQFLARWQQIGHGVREIVLLLRTLFDEVALSPYTDFVEKTLAFLRLLVEKGHLGAEDRADFLSYLLRHLGRHLTAYDLIAFHHRGANYPDALLLDAVLKDYLAIANRHPELFTGAAGSARDEQWKRIRRRALRQGWFLRRFYENLPVPNLPTSPGENARILPPPFGRVPEEEIVHPEKRSRLLFADDPLIPYLSHCGRELLQQSSDDLRHPLELRELGMALFLDRPLSLGKVPGQPDQTPLLSYEAFSRFIAGQRLRVLSGMPEFRITPEMCADYQARLSDLSVRGVPLDPHKGKPRPGVVSIEDARAVAEDFVFMRTTRRSVGDFLALFDFSHLGQRCSLDYLSPMQRLLILRGQAGTGQTEGLLTIYDTELRRRLELQVDLRAGYAVQGGVEYPVAGLRVLAIWEGVAGRKELREQRVESEDIRIPARTDFSASSSQASKPGSQG
jgi:hypothetical protein